MYNYGAKIGCGSCGRLSGARWDFDARKAAIEYDLERDPTPENAFWAANDMASDLEQWLVETPFPAPLIHNSASGRNDQVDPVWVNAVVDSNLGLTEIKRLLQAAQPYIATWPKGAHAFQWLDELNKTIQHIAEINRQLLAGYRNTAQGIADAKRVDQTATIAAWVDDMVRKATIYATNFVKQVGPEIVKPLKEIGWEDVLKLLLPVAVVGGLAFYAIRKA